ncbi:MAG: M48 family metallopeptidase [bacterium]|nr:M48 family metallopeptidase [bacterium]
MIRELRNSIWLIVLMAFVVISCTTVAITGRKQLNIIPNSQMLTMSFEQYNQVLAESELSRDGAACAMIDRVGQRIAGAVEQYFADQGLASELQGYDWEFRLIASDQVNAWCMPGGKVAFYTGILPVCDGEGGVAVVMGHEVAHAIARHGAERMSQGLLTQLGGVALSEALEEKPEETRNLWLSVYGLGTQVGALLPYGRLHESEADRLGLIFMAMAGYDPHAAVPFWQRMAANSEGAAPPEFLSTHPANTTRIARIRESMPEAMSYFSP